MVIYMYDSEMILAKIAQHKLSGNAGTIWLPCSVLVYPTNEELYTVYFLASDNSSCDFATLVCATLEDAGFRARVVCDI